MTTSNGKTSLPQNRIASQMSPDHIRPLGEDQQVTLESIEEVATKFEAERRLTQPTGVIAIGGTGVEVAKRLHKNLPHLNNPYCSFLNIDTDPNAINGSDFSESEFCWLRTNRIHNVLDHPEMHEAIVQRADLTDLRRVAFHQELVNQGLDHGGQVRSFGLMSFLSEYSNVTSRIAMMIRELTGTLARLKKQIEFNGKSGIRDRIRFYVITSTAGGTGSSMALGVMALLNQLVKNLDVEIIPVLLGASVFELELEGRSEQLARTKANTYAMVQELAAFQDGFSTRFDVALGPDQNRPLYLQAGFCDQIIWVGRKTADGRDYGSANAVYDMVANWLAAMIGTELSDTIQLEDRNDSTTGGQSIDRRTRMPRVVSTIAATCLTVDAKRIESYCTNRTLGEFIRKVVIGDTPDAKNIQRAVGNWMNCPDGDSTVSLTGSALVEKIKRACMPPIDSRTKVLFDGMSGRNKVHYRDRIFAERLTALRGQIDRDLMPKCDAQVVRCTQSLIEVFRKALRKSVDSSVADHGSSYVIKFGQLLEQRNEKQAASMIAAAEKDERQAAEKFAKIDESAARMTDRRWKVTKAKRDQSRLVAELSVAVDLATSAKSKRAASQIMTALAASANRIMLDAIENCKAAEAKIASCNQHCEDARAGGRITTDSLAEIDVASESSDRKLYERFRPEIARLGPANQRSEWLLRLCTNQEALQSLTKQLRGHFRRELRRVTVIDLLADQLSNPQTRSAALAKIRQVMQGTQPAWQAESGVNGIEFADTLIVGAPKGSVETERDLVMDHMMSLASTINTDAQYRSTPKTVVSGDHQRIYCIRRTSNAAFHYLDEIKDCEAAYREWTEGGGHPVHIFGADAVSKMPALLPQPKPKASEIALAIGLAYGFISQRGPHYYANLNLDADGTYRCPLASHWPTIGSHTGPNCEHGALASLTERQQVVFEHSDELNEADKLGDSLRSTAAAIAERPTMIASITAVIDEMRALAGDERLAAELDRYIGRLSAASDKYNGELAMFRKLTDVLSAKADELR